MKSSAEEIKVCCSCNACITKDDIGANKKLISKNVKKFLCVECLADYLGIDPETLRDKINQFKEEGCVLFL